MRNVFKTVLSCGIVILCAADAARAAQDSLSTARALYASAEYEEALASLNRIRSTGIAVAEVPLVEQYRAFCLLALGRATEAEDAIAAIVSAAPSYSPLESDTSPRVRTAFSDVRRRVLPTVVQQKYLDAKAAFERKEYAVARDRFAQVMAVFDDPSVTALDRPPLSDLRMLAKGFLDLAVTELAVTTPAPPPAKPEAAPVTAAAPDAGRIYTATEPNLVPPVTIRQELPPYPRRPQFPVQGIVEVVIDEKGAVASAVIRATIDPLYDGLALAATRTWSYRPATRNGVPVKFRKLVQVKVQP